MGQNDNIWLLLVDCKSLKGVVERKFFTKNFHFCYEICDDYHYVTLITICKDAWGFTARITYPLDGSSL